MNVIKELLAHMQRERVIERLGIMSLLGSGHNGPLHEGVMCRFREGGGKTVSFSLEVANPFSGTLS